MWRETTMDVAKLGQRQLFGMKKENLFKRVLRSFEQNQQVAEVVEYLVAILVRHSLCVSDFSLQPLKELIHELFLSATPNDTLRQHCVYFQHFFSDEEWQTITQRLFSSKEEYQASTKEACSYKNYWRKKVANTHKNPTFNSILSPFLKIPLAKNIPGHCGIQNPLPLQRRLPKY